VILPEDLPVDLAELPLEDVEVLTALRARLPDTRETLVVLKAAVERRQRALLDDIDADGRQIARNEQEIARIDLKVRRWRSLTFVLASMSLIGWMLVLTWSYLFG
jgi:hypothetical protein